MAKPLTFLINPRSPQILSMLLLVLSILSFKQLNSKNIISNYNDYPLTKSNFTLTKITEDLNYPWGITFVNDYEVLITEKEGRIHKVNVIDGSKVEITHNIPNILASQQGGLLDILYHKGFVFVTYSYVYDYKTNKSCTAIGRGKLIKNKIENFENLFVSQPPIESGKHFGSRLVIVDNFLFAGIGERGKGMIAQDPTKHPGSFIKISLDGKVPSDNPGFESKTNWLPEIFSIGVRNPQGMTLSPFTGDIYFSQHGPRGGDNIGIVKKSANFGWKEIAWGGKEYYGKKIGIAAFDNKYELPVKSWVPSIGVGNIVFYQGKTFPEWVGDLFVTSTKSKMLIRLDFEKNKIVNEEIIIKEKIGRIRDVELNGKGEIFLITDEANSFLWKLSK